MTDLDDPNIEVKVLFEIDQMKVRKLLRIKFCYFREK